MGSKIPENVIYNITQRDEETSNESEDDHCVNENSDEEATILTVYKIHDGIMWSKSSSNSLQGLISVENFVRVQGSAARFILHRVETSIDVFEEPLVKNSLSNFQKYSVAEAKQ